jgi:hypothetical protein
LPCPCARCAMPNSMFGRFRRHAHDNTTTSPPPSNAGFGLATTTSLPSFVPEEDDGEDVSPTNTTAPSLYGIFPEVDRDSDRDPRKLSHSHRRESSILSLGTNSVQGLRRSVSLRSQRSHSSASPYGHRSRQSSHLSNLPISPDEVSPHQQPQSRKKPSISTFPFAKQAKSAENLSLFSPTYDDAPPVPSLSRLDLHAKSSFPMLAGAAPSLRRHATDRPSVSSQGIGGSNGAPLQPAPTLQGVSMSGQNPSAVYQSILETTQKRMATIDYLKRVHEGDVYYMTTLHYPQGSVSAMPLMQLLPAWLQPSSTTRAELRLANGVPQSLDSPPARVRNIPKHQRHGERRQQSQPRPHGPNVQIRHRSRQRLSERPAIQHSNGQLRQRTHSEQW